MNTEEKTFEEIITSTEGAIEGIIKMASYWRSRCLLAEKYIHSKAPFDRSLWQLKVEDFPVTYKSENDETQP